MKKLLLLIAIVLFCSCSNDDKNSSENQLKGEWALISISGGINSQSSPKPEQKITIEFAGNILKTYNNGTLTNTQSFSYQTKKSIFGGIKKMIEVQSNLIANDIPKLQSFEIKGDELYLKDECYDCYTYKYARINAAKL